MRSRWVCLSLMLVLIGSLIGMAQAQDVGGGPEDWYWSVPASVAACKATDLRPYAQGNCPPLWSYLLSKWYGQGPAKDSENPDYNFPYVKVDLGDAAFLADLAKRCPSTQGGYTVCTRRIICPKLEGAGIQIPSGRHSIWSRMGWALDAQGLYVCRNPSTAYALHGLMGEPGNLPKATQSVLKLLGVMP